MAYGSMRPMRSEANKVFGRDAKPAHMSDGRVDPLVPLGAVLSRWQWGWVRPTPSTEQIGERLGDERWRARLGLKPEQGGSPDRAAPMLDGLSLEEWNEMMLEDFFVARRAGILTDDGLYGKRCAVLDLNELFKSEKVHCDQCQVRDKTVRDEQGEKRRVREYYHQAVALSWVSGKITLVRGWEVVAPGEGELTAGLRLLERLLPRRRKSLDLIVGAALYLLSALFPNRLQRRPGGLGPQFRKDGDG